MAAVPLWRQDSPSPASVAVTPETASEWLSRSRPGQRAIRKNHVNEMARDMIAGRWAQTHVGIAFDVNGYLVDGHHRLHAIVESGVTITMPVAYGLSDEAFFRIDQGRPRSVADTVTAVGIAQGSQVSSTAGVLIVYRDYPEKVWGGSVAATKSEVHNFVVANHDALRIAVGRMNAVRKYVPVHPTAFAAFTYLAEDAGHSDMLDTFCRTLAAGTMLAPGDPIHTLRQHELRRVSANSTWGRQARLAVYIKAFNSWLAGREVQIVMYRRSELPMPQVTPSAGMPF
jgi:hypothetical protein